MTGTVKAVAWQLARGEGGHRLPVSRVDAILREAGAPDFARTHPLEDVPAAPFLDALRRLDDEHPGIAPASAREVGRGVARVWARLNPEAATTLTTDPSRFPDTYAAVVHAFVTGVPGAARVADAQKGLALVEATDALPDAFHAGLIEGLASVAGVRATATTEAPGRHRVEWSFPGTEPARSPVRLLAQAARASFLPLALVPVLVGAAAAAGATGGAVDPLILALTLAGIAFLQLGMNALNDYFDRAADAANPTPTRFSGGSRVIQRGLLTPRAVLALAVGLVAAGSVVGVALYAARGAPVLWLGVAGVLAGVLYSAPPVRLAHRGMGEAAFGVIFGPLVVAGAEFVQRGDVGVTALAASVPLGLLVAAVLFANEFPDVRGDALTGKRTLVVRLGVERAVPAFGLTLAAAFASLVLAVALDLLPVTALVALLATPLAWRAYRVMAARHREPYGLLPAQRLTLALHLVTGLLLAAALLPWGVFQ